MFLHLGDFAYDTYDDKGIKGDLFFQKMSSTLTTRIPYIIIGGNHEWPDSGRLFQYRFQMPGCIDRTKRFNFYYSFDYKMAHFVMFDYDYTFRYFRDYNEGEASNQAGESLESFAWLANDLKHARENPEIKWIIFSTHRPSICTDPTSPDC